MGQDSKIEWTHHSFNPWWGCLKVSEECEHCYAETFAHRYGHDIWGPAKTTNRRLFGDKHWNEPIKWNALAEKQGVRRRVFCASMADVFEEHPQLIEQREKLWELISKTPWLDWLLLTKRPENILRMMPHSFKSNVWLGTSVGSMKTVAFRIDALTQARSIAKVLFLSCEPLLELVDLRMALDKIDWVIVGGESGPGKRPFNPDWARSIRSDCRETNTAFFMKQWDKVKEVPSDLMIREFPKV